MPSEKMNVRKNNREKIFSCMHCCSSATAPLFLSLFLVVLLSPKEKAEDEENEEESTQSTLLLLSFIYKNKIGLGNEKTKE